VRAGQTEPIAQEVDEEQPRLHVQLVSLTIDGDGDLNGAHFSPLEVHYAGPERDPIHVPLIVQRPSHTRR
jgi:hypothetical protein